MELQKKAKFSKKNQKTLRRGKKLNAELSCPLPINSWPLGRRFRVYGRANVAVLEKIFLLTFICMRKTKKKNVISDIHHLWFSEWSDDDCNSHVTSPPVKV